MQTYSVHPHHITWRRTDFQHSVLLVVWLNVYTVVTIHLTLCGARQQNFCHKILFRTLNSCFIYVWAYVIRHTYTHTQAKSLFVFVKWTTSINKFYYQQIALILIYVVGSKSFRPDIQKPRQMENAEGYIVPALVRLMYQLKSVLK